MLVDTLFVSQLSLVIDKRVYRSILLSTRMRVPTVSVLLSVRLAETSIHNEGPNHSNVDTAKPRGQNVSSPLNSDLFGSV
jgi:hypothetical protein